MDVYNALFAMDGTLLPSVTGRAAPVAMNGRAGNIDLSAPVSFVNDDNRIVLASNGVFCLGISMGYAIWVAQGRPTAATPVTVDHIRAASPRLGQLIVQHDIMSAMLVLDPPVELSLRSSDAVPKPIVRAATVMEDLNAVPPILNGVWNPCIQAANMVFAKYTKDVEFATKLCPDGLLVTLMIIANALHRETCAGHNWLTAAARKRATPTARASMIAGPYRDALLDFADRNNTGHDLWHYLSDKTMRAMACALTGAVTHIIPNPFTWSGEKYDDPNVDFASIVSLPESATDRYPSGLAGKSALITGLTFMREMSATIALRTAGVSIEKVTGSVDMMMAIMDDGYFDRTIMLEMRTTLRSSIAIACGFVAYDRDGSNRIDAVVSLAKYVAEDVSSKVTGKALAEFVSSRDFNREGMAKMINSVMNSFVVACEGLAAAHLGKLTTKGQDAVNLTQAAITALPLTASHLPANVRERADYAAAAKAESDINTARVAMGQAPINFN